MQPTGDVQTSSRHGGKVETHGVLLTPVDIAELKTIYRRKYQEDLSDDEAWELGNRLIRVFSVLTRVQESSAKVRTPSHLPSTADQL